MRFLPLLLLLISSTLWAQHTENKYEEEAFFIKSIHDAALTRGSCYDWLMYLTQEIGGRLAGSPEAAAAVEYTRQIMDTLGLDTVYLQPCMVPRWQRGAPEVVRVASSPRGSFDLNALALGNSVGTGEAGISAPIIEVMSLDEVEELPREAVEGKIVFYNRPMDPTQLNTFSAYGGAVDQRALGASRAARKGAIGVLVRSMTTRIDDIPHTGSMAYEDPDQKIPAVAISTQDAEILHDLLATGDEVSVYMQTHCRMLPEVLSYNVIGEIYGSTHPDEIILVGGHLDSWDVGTGAHDDGAGCVQAIEVLHLLQELEYQPRRTLRCVMFMNEENGLRGGRAYWKDSNNAEEYHMAAIESDRGGFTPRGFSVDAEDDIFLEKFKNVVEWLPLLEPYGLTFEKGGSGADISGLKSQRGLLFGFLPDTQRYFDYHHTPIDGPDVVNKRELELGAAAITSLVYLLDKYGIEGQ